jgi:CRP-like cAMP-binding protein
VTQNAIVQPRLIWDGWATLERDGRIMGLLVPMEHLAPLTGPSLYTVRAITPLQLLAESQPQVSTRAYLERLVRHAKRLTVMSCRQRTADFLVELLERLERAHLVKDETFTLPLAQSVLASLLAMSSVHMNRVVKQLRTEGLVDVRKQVWRLPDLTGLRAAAGARGSHDDE